jgi:glycosyltransferase involved in cell wall biosynthesis
VGTVSIILPVHNQADHIDGVVGGYLSVVQRLQLEVDLVLVVNKCTDRSMDVCRRLAERHLEVRTLELVDGGWGRAVRAGLASARGDLLCYANSARTSPEILALMLSYARVYPEVVLKANRRIRDSVIRRAGSLLYNLEDVVQHAELGRQRYPQALSPFVPQAAGAAQHRRSDRRRVHARVSAAELSDH